MYHARILKIDSRITDASDELGNVINEISEGAIRNHLQEAHRQVEAARVEVAYALTAAASQEAQGD